MARIAVGGFHHETNCFVEPKTDYAYFNVQRDRPPLVRGQAVFDRLAGSTFALAGFMAETEGSTSWCRCSGPAAAPAAW